MNKKGQFYLVAAIIIIGIVFGLVSTKNYVKGIEDDVKIEYLSSEIKEEGARVVDYGIINYPNKKTIEFIDLVATNYAKDKAQNLVFIYGDEGGIAGKMYKDVKSNINIGNEIYVEANVKKSEPVIPVKSGNKISITVNDNDYEFKLNPGENFYIILEKEVENEKYINFK